MWVSWALWQISDSEVCLSCWALRGRNDSSPLLLAYLPFAIRWLLNPIFRSSSKGVELWQAAEGAPGCFLRSEVFCLPKVRGFHLSVYIRMSQPVACARSSSSASSRNLSLSWKEEWSVVREGLGSRDCETAFKISGAKNVATIPSIPQHSVKALTCPNSTAAN